MWHVYVSNYYIKAGKFYFITSSWIPIQEQEELYYFSVVIS